MTTLPFVNVVFNKEAFINEINNYINEYKLTLITFTFDEMRCYQILSDTSNIRMFDEVKIEKFLTCDMIDLENTVYFLNFGINIFDVYAPLTTLLNLLNFLDNFNYTLNYYQDDEDDYYSKFFILFEDYNDF